MAVRGFVYVGFCIVAPPPGGTQVQVHTRFFAAYRDLVGTPMLSMDVPDGSRVSDLVQVLRARGGGFAALPLDPAVAVNLAYSTVDEALSEGDEVAFIPPVAGG